LLILFLGIILWVFYRYHLDIHPAYTEGNFPRIDLSKIPLTVSQVKTRKNFVIVVALFFVQALLGALLPAKAYTPRRRTGSSKRFGS
jgi:nitric oxide reductase subunit B